MISVSHSVVLTEMNDRLMFSLVGELKKENCATVPIVFSRSQAQQPVVRWQGYYALAVQITTDTGQEREYPELQLTDHTPETLFRLTKTIKAARISAMTTYTIGS